MKKLHKLLLSICSPIVATPTVLATSCAPTYKPSMYQVEFTNDSVSTSLKDCSKPTVSMQELICGTKKFHSGNYMIILGSECSEYSNKFFSNNPQFSKTHYDYASDDAFVGSLFYNCINKDAFVNSSVDFGLVLYIDIESAKTANKDLLRPEQYRKFDEKWDSSEVKEAEDRNINTKNKKVIVENKFKRNDKSAATMRSLLEYLKTIFTFDSFTFGCSTSDDMPFGMVWKEGVPQKDYFKKIPVSDAKESAQKSEEYFDNTLELWNQKD